MSQISGHTTIDELHARAMVEYGAHLQRVKGMSVISVAALDVLRAATVQRWPMFVAHVVDTATGGDRELLAVGELVARNLVVWRMGSVYVLTSGAVSLRGRLL